MATGRTFLAGGEGLNISLHPAGPKWTITCGNCGNTWRRRVPKVNRPRFPCPHCNEMNLLNVVWESAAEDGSTGGATDGS